MKKNNEIKISIFTQIFFTIVLLFFPAFNLYWYLQHANHGNMIIQDLFLIAIFILLNIATFPFSKAILSQKGIEYIFKIKLFCTIYEKKSLILWEDINNFDYWSFNFFWGFILLTNSGGYALVLNKVFIKYNKEVVRYIMNHIPENKVNVTVKKKVAKWDREKA